MVLVLICPGQGILDGISVLMGLRQDHWNPVIISALRLHAGFWDTTTTTWRGMAGEAWSQPGVGRGSVQGPMMGDTPPGLVARRMWPSRVGHLRVG